MYIISYLLYHTYSLLNLFIYLFIFTQTHAILLKNKVLFLEEPSYRDCMLGTDLLISMALTFVLGKKIPVGHN